jgi:hypothetical protein
MVCIWLADSRPWLVGVELQVCRKGFVVDFLDSRILSSDGNTSFHSGCLESFSPPWYLNDVALAS